MTAIVPGTIDVLVVRPLPDGWRVLVVRRGPHTRCPGAWETVHGKIEPGERPPAAAVREVREECGLEVARLYSVAVQPFYLAATDVVQLAIGFCAFVAEPAVIVLGDEHQAAEWLPVDEALARFAWPRERVLLQEAHALLADGHAGAVEDVLRVR